MDPRKIKICFLADASDIHTQKWVTYFSKRGHNVHLISFLPANIPGVVLHNVKRTIPIWISWTAPAWGKIGYLFYRKQIRKLVYQIQPDILHAHWASSYGFLGASTGFHPFLVSTWGRDVFDFPKQSIVHRKLLEYVLGKADILTATSKMLNQETRKYISKKSNVHTIPFGVDLRRFKPLKRTGEKPLVIGIVKKLEKKYGIRYLIEAFAQVEKNHHSLKLWIVGTGSQDGLLKRLVHRLNLEDNVVFWGFINNHKIPKILNEMDIFVVPSIEPSETFGVAAVEAAACGLPVIASNIGGLPEVVIDGETGFLIPPKEPQEIVEKLILLIQNKELRKQMGKESRKFVESNYNWFENTSRMESLYYNLNKG